MSHWTSSMRRDGSPAARRSSNERDERRLRGARPREEHRLSREQAADRDSVEPAGEPLGVPRLDGVRPAEFVQAAVGGLDPAVDPAVRIAWPRTAGDDVGEGGVDSNLEPACRTAERAGRRERVERHDAAPPRREPPEARPDRHGEQAAAIRGEQSPRFEVGAERPEVLGVVVRRRLERPRRGRWCQGHAEMVLDPGGRGGVPGCAVRGAGA